MKEPPVSAQQDAVGVLGEVHCGQVGRFDRHELAALPHDDTAAGKADPERAARVDEEAADLVQPEGRRVPAIVGLEADAVEARQTLGGAYPEVTVGGLRDDRDRERGESLFDSPALDPVLREAAVRIESGERGDTDEQEPEQQPASGRSRSPPGAQMRPSAMTLRTVRPARRRIHCRLSREMPSVFAASSAEP